MTSFFDTTTNLWLNAFLAWRGGGVSKMMTTATTTTKTTTMKDDNDTRTTTKTPTARTTTNSFFDTTTNLWLDAFLAGRVVVFNKATTIAGERVY